SAGVGANVVPGNLHGTARLQNLAAWIPGIKDRLLLSEAEAQITDATLTLNHVTGQFEHSPIAFTGSVAGPLNCSAESACPLEFDLHFENLAVADVATVLGFSDKGWNLPFISGSDNKLPDFRAAGTLAVGELKVAEIPLEKFAARVEVGDHALTLNHMAAKVAGGSTQGEWKVDWSGSQPRYIGSGSLEGAALDRVGPLDTPAGQIAQWISGRGQISYNVRFEGKSPADMLSSTGGRVEFQVSNGNSRIMALESGRPLRFQAAQGALEIDKQSLKILPSKFKAENRIYIASGNISLANKQAKVKVTAGGNQQWEITGALEKPQITPQPMTAQAGPARTK